MQTFFVIMQAAFWRFNGQMTKFQISTTYKYFRIPSTGYGKNYH